jgi:hypothetical protein
MKVLAQWFGGAVSVVAVVLLSCPQPAKADTYEILNLGVANANSIFGMDTAGDVVVFGGSGCGQYALSCYTTYTNGLAVADSTTAPDMVFDDGTPCSSPAGFNASKSVCNNGLMGLGGYFNPNGDKNGVYLGSASDLQLLQGGTADQVFLNSAGDFAWTDGLDEEIFEAVDMSAPDDTLASIPSETVVTPEPGSVVLLATGLVFFTAALRRKVLR